MILVTGGAGFIGTNFIYNWLKNNKEGLVNLDILSYASNIDNLKPLLKDDRYKFIKGDIGDRKNNIKILKEFNISGVINFAAESHVDRSINKPDDFFISNVMGTLGLLESVREFFNDLTTQQKKKFIFLHVSTDEVFGSLSLNDEEFTENSVYKPNSPYSASKASSDHMVRAWSSTYNIPSIVTNCSNNYGPYQYPEKLIPLIIQKAINKEKIPIYGDGKNIRDWLYVTDHCSAIETIFKKGMPGEKFNIGGDSEKTNLEVVEIICNRLDALIPKKDKTSYKSLIKFVTDRPGHDKRYAVNTSKIKEKLDWKPSISFEEGINTTIDWYLANVSWLDKIKQKIKNN